MNASPASPGMHRKWYGPGRIFIRCFDPPHEVQAGRNSEVRLLVQVVDIGKLATR